MITAKERKIYNLLEENDIIIKDGYVISPFWEELSPELGRAISYLIMHKGFGWRNKDERNIR